jgi:hypothetical protein
VLLSRPATLANSTTPQTANARRQARLPARATKLGTADFGQRPIVLSQRPLVLLSFDGKSLSARHGGHPLRVKPPEQCGRALVMFYHHQLIGEWAVRFTLLTVALSTGL